MKPLSQKKYGELTLGQPEMYQFLEDPQVRIQSPIATHIIVKSPTHSATAVLDPEPSADTKIERLVKIDSGDVAACQTIADELLDRWGRDQVSVTGVIPLNVLMKFKQKVFVVIPESKISDSLTVQSKKHNITNISTRVVLGDIILDQDELLSRIIEELGD